MDLVPVSDLDVLLTIHEYKTNKVAEFSYLYLLFVCRLQDMLSGSLSVRLWGSSRGDSLPLPVCGVATWAGREDLCRWETALAVIKVHMRSCEENHCQIWHTIRGRPKQEECYYLNLKYRVKNDWLWLVSISWIGIFSAHWSNSVMNRIYYVAFSCLTSKSDGYNYVIFLSTKLLELWQSPSDILITHRALKLMLKYRGTAEVDFYCENVPFFPDVLY